MFFFLAFSWYRVPKNDVLFFFQSCFMILLHVYFQISSDRTDNHHHHFAVNKIGYHEQNKNIQDYNLVFQKNAIQLYHVCLTFLVFSPYFWFSFLKLGCSFNFSEYEFRSGHLLSRSQTYDPVREKPIDSRLPVPPSTFWFPYLYGKSNFKHAWILIKIWYVPVF